MASNGSHRSGLLTAGGALSIAAGILEVIGGVSITVLGDLELLLFWLPDVWGEHIGDLAQPPPPPPMWPLIMIGFVLGALGIFAIIGGVSAIRRRSFGVSLVGAICALPSVVLGILAVVFVALRKREFEAQK